MRTRIFNLFIVVHAWYFSKTDSQCADYAECNIDIYTPGFVFKVEIN